MPGQTVLTKRHKSQRLTIFNHKGGVGKTTLTVNVAAALAAQGKRILLVDSDPQCNLTGYLVETSVVDDLLDNSDSEQGRTIWSAVKPIVEAEGDVRAVEPIERLKNVYLVPGDIRLSEFEQELTQLWGDCFQRKTKGFRGTSALSSLINQIANTYDIDYVFYDSGPNIGPLNRVILLDCDHFIVPAACDLFSIRALKAVGHTLAEWIQDWGTIVKLAPDNIYMLPGYPKFLGYIPQRFRVYGGEVSSDYAKYLSRIERHVYSDIVTVLRRIDPALASSSMSQNKLGLIKDFGGTATASQTEGIPIKDVTSGSRAQRDAAESSFAAIAKKIIQRTS
jgi:cellulose biosynthesis protein BcsQ